MFSGNVLLYSAGLTHQKGFAEVATRLLRDLLGKLRWEEQTLLFTDCCQNITDLVNRKTETWGILKCCLHCNKRVTHILDILTLLPDEDSLKSKPHHLHLTSSVLGRGTLIARQRLLIGPMTLEVEVEHKMRRQVLMYFSIVRRKACWASFVSLSTSVSNTTEKKQFTNQYKNGILTLWLHWTASR